MGLGLQPSIGRATFWLNSRLARILPQRRHLLVLTYHRVGSHAQLYPESAGLAECSGEEFEAEMEWLRRNCTILDASEVLSVVRGESACPNRAVFVTFDDGYREDLFRVKGCLDRLRIRPTVFLPTDFIGTRRRFWWDRVSVCVQLARTDRLSWDLDGAHVELPLSSPEDRVSATAELTSRAKAQPDAGARERFVAALEGALGVADTREAERPLVVSWDEARELHATFDFGAHTLSHPVLSQLSSDEARRELAESKEEIERRLAVPCSTVAIPYGGGGDYSEETLRLAAETGFAMIFSLEETLRGPIAVPPRRPAERGGPAIRRGELYLVDRIALSARGGLPVMALKLTWPELFVPSWTDRAARVLQKVPWIPKR
jgi:peptidoglycan/xylan/chitin deacetylase (PgdA/CDA1 family)